MTRYGPTLAYVLHTRPYRETSVLLEVLTKDEGRVSLIGKGLRAGHRRSLAQPFTLLQVLFQGRTDLFTLTQVEALNHGYSLKGDALFSGFYLNELLMHVLHKHDTQAELFSAYHDTLQQLTDPMSLEPALRGFEKTLLRVLGYGINFSSILPEEYYIYSAGHGFLKVNETVFAMKGIDLLAFAEDRLQSETELKTAKKLTRLILSDLLGDKVLNSRALFIA